jgi:hypothetical protein
VSANALKSDAMTGCRAMIRTSQPGWNEGAITLSASRSRLRTRFRTTAPPSLRPVENPKRVTSRSVRRIRITSREWDLTVPLPWSAAKSPGLESITSRGELWPRSVVRPLASCGRALVGQPVLGVPRWSSCGRGSRAPWSDAASWAGRSASSDGGYLSIRPRGSEYPERHANAPGAEKALQRVCRRIIGTDRALCQTPWRRLEVTGRTRPIPDRYSLGVCESYPSRTLRRPGGRCILRRLTAPDNPELTRSEGPWGLPDRSGGGVSAIASSRRRTAGWDRVAVTFLAISMVAQD